MRDVLLSVVIGALAAVILFGFAWLLCSFIALEWVEPYWALLRGMVGIFSFSAAATTAVLALMESDW